MKTLRILLLSAIFSMAALFCRAGDEKPAVQEAIDNEYKAYLDGNFDEWSGWWIHESYVSQNYSGCNGYSIVNTFDSLAANVKKTFEYGYQKGQKISKTVTGLIVIDNIAVADVDEFLSFYSYGQEQTLEGKAVYLLKKVDGKWKLVSQNCILVNTCEPNDANAEAGINLTGYWLLQMSKPDEALKVFKLNTELYPNSFNAWDSLAEAYMAKGEKADAIKYYKKSLELNPNNANAAQKLEKLMAK